MSLTSKVLYWQMVLSSKPKICISVTFGEGLKKRLVSEKVARMNIGIIFCAPCMRESQLICRQMLCRRIMKNVSLDLLPLACAPHEFILYGMSFRLAGQSSNVDVLLEQPV